MKPPFLKVVYRDAYGEKSVIRHELKSGTGVHQVVETFKSMLRAFGFPKEQVDQEFEGSPGIRIGVNSMDMLDVDQFYVFSIGDRQFQVRRTA